MQPKPKANQEVVAYKTLQMLLGLFGFALPITLVFQGLRAGFQPTISEFYYTEMGDVFVGILWAIGTFLLCYNGYPREPGETLSDRMISIPAGLAAIGVACFPVDYALPIVCPPEGCLQTGLSGTGMLHYLSAAIFFASLAVFCLFRFTKGDRGADNRILWTPRNRVYVTCGLLIVLGAALVLPYRFGGLGLQAAYVKYHIAFWAECLAVVAFSWSWLQKADAPARALSGLRGLAP